MIEERLPAELDDYALAARCKRCLFSPGLCVCESLPTFELPFHVGVIRHRTEIEIVSNTGRFVPRLLANASIHELGLQAEPFDGTWLRQHPESTFVLFPEQGAETVSPDHLRKDSPTTLVVLDGTWRKARRMLRRIPELRGLRRVALPAPRPDGLSPRKTKDASGHCTIEAVAAAVGAVGFASESEALWGYSRALIERIRHVQGRIPRPQIPRP